MHGTTMHWYAMCHRKGGESEVIEKCAKWKE